MCRRRLLCSLLIPRVRRAGREVRRAQGAGTGGERGHLWRRCATARSKLNSSRQFVLWPYSSWLNHETRERPRKNNSADGGPSGSLIARLFLGLSPSAVVLASARIRCHQCENCGSASRVLSCSSACRRVCPLYLYLSQPHAASAPSFQR
jgi:hypothetical protein